MAVKKKEGETDAQNGQKVVAALAGEMITYLKSIKTQAKAEELNPKTARALAAVCRDGMDALDAQLKGM